MARNKMVIGSLEFGFHRGMSRGGISVAKCIGKRMDDSSLVYTNAGCIHNYGFGYKFDLNKDEAMLNYEEVRTIANVLQWVSICCPITNGD